MTSDYQNNPFAPKKGFASVSSVLENYKVEEDKYISREFQQYGYSLAEELGDLAHKSLYIKMAKETPRGVLERAMTFVKDAGTARSKARLFMWKVKQLKDEIKKKNESRK